MKKQLFFLYFLLFLFLCVIGYSGFLLLTMETEPETPVEFVEYAEFQQEVEVSEAPSEPDETQGSQEVYVDFDLEELLSINKHFDSWLLIPDTLISFPVIRTTDNYYYLDHGFDKKANRFGCLYFDSDCVKGSENQVIHGHNMGVNRTEMFSTLVEYQDETYAQEHITAYLATSPNEPATVYELFAVVNFDLVKNYPFDYVKPFFNSPEDKQAFVSYLQNLSIYETKTSPEGKLLILSTCNRGFGGDNRLLICFAEKNGD